jgi:hypothetical protein
MSNVQIVVDVRWEGTQRRYVGPRLEQPVWQAYCEHLFQGAGAGEEIARSKTDRAYDLLLPAA